MTDSRKQTLARLIDLASEGNAHAVPALHQVLDLTSDRRERQHVVNAIQKAGRAFRKATEATAPVKPTQAPKISPAVFEMDAETALRWEIVQNAAK